MNRILAAALALALCAPIVAHAQDILPCGDPRPVTHLEGEAANKENPNLRQLLEEANRLMGNLHDHAAEMSEQALNDSTILIDQKMLAYTLAVQTWRCSRLGAAHANEPPTPDNERTTNTMNTIYAIVYCMTLHSAPGHAPPYSPQTCNIWANQTYDTAESCRTDLDKYVARMRGVVQLEGDTVTTTAECLSKDVPAWH